MPRTIQNRADVEYAIMLAVLNFQRDFMQSNYSHIQVRFLGNAIEVDLTISAPIPAETRRVQSEEGQTQLRQRHQALHAAGQERLQKELMKILSGPIYDIRADLDPLTGKTTMVIGLVEADERSVS